MPALLPANAEERALVFGLAHELCGEAGLAWARRLQLIHLGLAGEGGFSMPVSKYLGKKYGYSTALGESSSARVIELLRMFAARLHAQGRAGSGYLVGDNLSAADIYLAAVMAMFGPLSQAQCAMDAGTRAAFETIDDATRAALDPVLFEHRDRIYAQYLALPLAL